MKAVLKAINSEFEVNIKINTAWVKRKRIQTYHIVVNIKNTIH